MKEETNCDEGTTTVLATLDILSVTSRNMGASRVMEAVVKVLCDPAASKTTDGPKDCEEEYAVNNPS